MGASTNGSAQIVHRETPRPCGRGPCAAEDGHEGTCAEASGFEDWSEPDWGDAEAWCAHGGHVHPHVGCQWCPEPTLEQPATADCPGCNLPVLFTWTSSAIGWGVYHHDCYLARMEER